MKTLVLSTAIYLIFSFALAQAQTETRKDSLSRAKAIQDSLRLESLFAKSTFPYIKGSKRSGAIPVDDPEEVPDPNRRYKLLFDTDSRNPDSLSGELNRGLDAIARILNLHVASGIPAKNIVPVIIVSGGGIEAVMNNEAYRKRHSMDNPNIALLEELQKDGAKIIACGQAMARQGATKDELLPGIRRTLSAMTVFSNYELQGFVHYPIHSDR